MALDNDDDENDEVLEEGQDNMQGGGARGGTLLSCEVAPVRPDSIFGRKEQLWWEAAPRALFYRATFVHVALHDTYYFDLHFALWLPSGSGESLVFNSGSAR